MEENTKLKILVDCREPDRNVKYLKDLNCEVNKIQLPIADYVYESKSIAFERKEIADFCQSMKGHIQKQLQQMQENFKYNYIILIGGINQYLRFNNRHFNVEQYCGSIASILVRYNVKIIPVDNNKQAMEIIVKICEKTEDGKVTNIYETELLKDKLKVEDIHLKMLLCIDGLGLKKAQVILAKWSFFELRNVTKEQLKEVDGIGDKLAEKIKTYIL